MARHATVLDADIQSRLSKPPEAKTGLELCYHPHHAPVHLEDEGRFKLAMCERIGANWSELELKDLRWVKGNMRSDRLQVHCFHRVMPLNACGKLAMWAQAAPQGRRAGNLDQVFC